VAGVQADATHVQVTANGYGEQTGSANLFTVAGNLMTSPRSADEAGRRA